MPATVFGPCEHIPDGMWVYQGGKVLAKVNVHVAGLTEYELTVVRATWDDNETPVAFLPPPDNALFDAAAVDFGSGAAGGPPPVDAVLPDEKEAEVPEEGPNREELPPPTLMRLDEVVEQLDIIPEVVPFADDGVFATVRAGQG